MENNEEIHPIDLEPNLFQLSAKGYRYIKIIKSKSTELILIPTILGTVIQLFSLYIIDPLLIKFFSISQIINDGLYILFTLLPLIFITPLIYVFLAPINLKKSEDSKGEKRKIIIINLVLLFYIIFFINLTYVHGKNYYILGITMVSVIGYVITKEYLKVIGKKWQFVFVKDIHNLITYISILIYFSITMIFNDIPENVANLETVSNNINSNFPHYKSEILYFNDNFIFAKIYCDSIDDPGAQILILKNDALFAFKNLE